MAADLTQGLRRSLRRSLMGSLVALRPYVVIGYWVDGYTVLD